MARRELREEAGIVPRKMIYLDSYNMGSKVISYHHFYIARGIAEQYDQELDGGEKIEILRISFEEFLSLFGTPDFVCHHKFQIWVMKEFIIPGQQAVLKELLFGM